MECSAGRIRRLSLANSRADVLFQKALEGGHRSEPRGAQSIPSSATDGQPATVVHVLPVRREAFYTLDGARHIVVVTQAGRRSGQRDPSVLRTLFDLTPAEARLAEALVRNSTLAEYGAVAGVFSNTVKTHLKRVFEKTGVTRQADLVTLLVGLYLN